MASKSSSATKKRTKKLQTFKDDYTAKWMCIISSKKSVNHARCTVCAYDFAIGHGGANDVLYGLITLSNWKKALSTDEHTCTGRKMLKISANAHARGNCTCNFSIAQKITDFVSKLLILSFIITGLCSGKLASLCYWLKSCHSDVCSRISFIGSHGEVIQMFEAWICMGLDFPLKSVLSWTSYYFHEAKW